jgi:hypothetical protein
LSTTSSPRIRAALRSAAVLALGLAACIQGPWDYYPDNPPPFRGVYATAYVLAGKPLTQVCFERVLDLGEEHTQAFAWYDSADVRISGPFSGQSRAVALAALNDTPNCFRGDTALRAQPGGVYALEARFVWDSAGSRVHSLVRGEAHVPDSFSIHRTAAAPSFAKTGGIPDNISDLSFLPKLPPAVRDTIGAEFGDSLNRFQPDTAGLGGYLERHGDAIQKRLVSLLGRDHFVYHEGDTLFYLNGILNTLSHYFSADRSPNVGCVLITQRFERNSGRPQTAFDSPLGFQPDSDQYYFPGDIRRLLIYPDAVGGRGWNLLDSMGVVNTWFHTLRNRFYFYGFEKAYYDYHTTATQTQGGGGGDGGDPRVKPKYNVSGGEGIFVGGIPDSFDLYIKTDSLTKVYPLLATRAFGCDKEGWSSSKDCREFYPEYCRSQAWQPKACGADAVRLCSDPAAAGDTSLGSLCDSIAPPARSDTAIAHEGERLYCIAKAFPAEAACDAPRTSCLEAKGRNACKDAFWDYCLDHQWRPDDICGPALASYCRDQPRLSETLCRHADAWCAAHADSPLCK